MFTDIEEVNVAAVSEIHHTKRVAVFFSLSLILPFFALFLIWMGVYAAFPYIRRHINNPENFPSIAALYWIGNTFTCFVIVMDMLTLFSSPKTDEHGSLFSYQYYSVLVITIVEVSLLLLGFICSVIPLFSHRKSVAYKTCIERIFKVVGCGWRWLSFKQIGIKEARVWVLLGCLVIPLVIAASSHIGFVVGGWVAYPERSNAIFLLYLFIFIFMYGSLQYMYMFSILVLNWCKKRTCIKKSAQDNRVHFNRLEERAAIEDDLVHHEEHLATNVQGIKDSGFNTVGLFFMLLLLIILNFLLLYLGFGLLLPLLSSIDDALVHIYNLGRYGIVITLFLLTYKVFTSNNVGSNQPIICSDTLRYWRFLQCGSQNNVHIVQTLQNAMKRLITTVEAFEQDDITNLVKEKTFDLEVVKDSLDKALKMLPTAAEERSFGNVVKGFKDALDLQLKLNDFTPKLLSLQGKIAQANDQANNLSREELKGLKIFCEGINHFRKTLVTILGIPPMYLYGDKANALTATLIYQKINTFPRPPENNKRYLLLLSLIEEEFAA